MRKLLFITFTVAILTGLFFPAEAALAEIDKDLLALAEAGNANAQYNIAFKYRHGSGIEKNMEEALKWYAVALKSGSAAAEWDVGYMYFEGEYLPKDKEMGFKLITSAANKGDPSALFFLALIYFKGDYVDQNKEKAIELYILSSSHGNIYANEKLGQIYLTGDGTEKDILKAMHYYHDAAEMLPNSANSLADIYYNGNDVQQDKIEAVKWYFSASDRGHDLASLKLAEMFYHGENGNSHDEQKFTKSFLNDYEEQIVTKNLNDAVYRYEKAIESGNPEAQFKYGEMLFT